MEGRGYSLVCELGRGGAGVVYLARQQSLDRFVALKSLRPELSQDVAILRRFAQEAQMLCELQHPQVVQVLDINLEGEWPYISFQYIAGAETLAEMLRACKLQDQDRVLELLALVAQGLAYLHGKKILHRDLKPENILVHPVEGPRIIDLGLARDVTPEVTRLTLAGHIVGTLSYMSPEQMMAEELTTASDVYAFGLIACEVFAGRPIFSASTREGQISASNRLVSEVPTVASWHPTLDPELAKLIDGCTRREPRARPRMKDIVAALMKEPAPATGNPVPERTIPGTPALGPLATRSPRLRDRVTSDKDPPGGTPSVLPPVATQKDQVWQPSQAPGGSSSTIAHPRRLVRVLAAGVAAFVIFLTARWMRTDRSTLSPGGAVPAQSLSGRLHAKEGRLHLELEVNPAAIVDLSWVSAGRPAQRQLSPASDRFEVDLSEGFGGAEGLVARAPGCPAFHPAPLLLPHMQRLAEHLRSLHLEKFSMRMRKVPDPVMRQLTLVAPLAPAWFREAGPTELRRKCLDLLYRLETVNNGLIEIKQPPIAPASSLLPEGWREKHTIRNLHGGPSDLGNQTPVGPPPKNARLDGKALETDVADDTATWFRVRYLLGLNGITPQRKITTEVMDLSASKGGPADSHLLEFDLDEYHLRDVEEIMLVSQACDPGKTVFAFDVNSRLRVPFCTPLDPTTTTDNTCFDRFRTIPADAFVPGRNSLRITFERCPVRDEAGGVYINELWIIFVRKPKLW